MSVSSRTIHSRIVMPDPRASRWIRAAIAIAAVVIAGCKDVERDAARGASEPGGGTDVNRAVANTVATVVANNAPARTLETCEVGPPPDPGTDWSKHVNAADATLPNGQPRDLGLGLAILSAEVSGEIHKGASASDSVILRQAPSDSAPIAAEFTVRSMMIGGVRHTCRGFTHVATGALQHRINLYASGVEFLAGLPVDSVASDSAWVRAAYAVDSAFTVHHAWIRTHGRAQHVSWLSLFARAGDSTMIFFRDSATRARPGTTFRLSPNGPAASVRLPQGAGAWSMYLDRVDGEWGEVRIEIGDVCGEGEIRKVPGKFWVKLVDERGRPLVLLPNEGIC